MTQAANLAALGTNVNSSGALSASTLTGALGYANMPAGSVLQVVNTIYSTYVSNSTSTYANTNVTATITPKFATSKILVIHSSQYAKNESNNSNAIAINLVRNGTQIVELALDLLYTGAAGGNALSNNGMSTCTYMDSPASTSALTYRTQFKNSGANSAVVYAQVNNTPGTMILMEIAA